MGRYKHIPRPVLASKRDPDIPCIQIALAEKRKVHLIHTFTRISFSSEWRSGYYSYASMYIHVV